MKHNFWRCLSFSPKDYLDSRSGNLDQIIKDFLRDKCSYDAEEVWLHTLPRMFGYVFNPVSFWFCRRQGELEAILVEVHNTFNQRHFYWIHPQGEIRSDRWLQTNKVFHVSPFFPVDGHYKFRFQVSDQRISVDINYYSNDDQLRLATGVVGELSPLTSVPLSSILLKYGWITPLVVLRIHYQAFKLWAKKMKFYSKPELPKRDVT